MKKRKILFSIFIIVIVIIITGSIITKPVNDLDEIWNFNFARNIANGLLPYKDFNMVQTPLLPILIGIVLKILGTELFITRILAIILLLSIIGTIYLICKELNIKEYYILLCISLIVILYANDFRIDYNFFVLQNLLLIIYFEIKNVGKINYKKDFIVSLIAGSCIWVKQSTGAVIIITYILYKLYELLSSNDKKIIIKSCFVSFLGGIIPTLIMCAYLSVNNIWPDFIEYAVLGVKSFTNKVSYMLLVKGKFGIISQILSIIIPIFLIYIVINLFIKKDKLNYKIWIILLGYSIASLFVMYPIADKMHFLVGILPLRYCIYIVFK